MRNDTFIIELLCKLYMQNNIYLRRVHIFLIILLPGDKYTKLVSSKYFFFNKSPHTHTGCFFPNNYLFIKIPFHMMDVFP